MSRNVTANIIRRKRLRLKMTQRALAEQIGCRMQTVCDWEAGRYEPHHLYAEKLESVFQSFAKQLRSKKC